MPRRGTAAWVLTAAGPALAGVIPLSLQASPAPAAAVVPPPAGALVVGTAGPACPHPGFATITAAVAAAPAGATIYVCAGHYAEYVVIGKNLTLLGAQWGVDARTGRSDPALETVISSDAGEFEYSGAVTTGTINGFTIQGATKTPPGDEDGIRVLNNISTGYTWVNNIITGNSAGINVHASGATPTTIEHNRIDDDNATGSTQGNGVFIASGVDDNATISDNDFTGNADAINTTGFNNETGPRSQSLVIEHNVSVDDGNFVTLFLAQHVLIADNTISWADPHSTSAGSAIYVSGGNLGVTVTGNTINGGAATGINLNNQFHPALPSSGLRISANTITHRLNGITISASSGSGPTVTDATISGNTVRDSGTGDHVTGPASGGNGIWLQAGSDPLVTGNLITGSISTDCRDETTGSGTAGTANTWTRNVGSTSFPAALCARPATPAITGVISKMLARPGDKVHQTVHVSGTHGQPGILAWQLLGPVPPVSHSCAGVSFASAPVLAHGTVRVTGDGRLTLPTVTLPRTGCYSYTDVLTGRTYTVSPRIPRGQPANTVLARANPRPPVPVTG